MQKIDFQSSTSIPEKKRSQQTRNRQELPHSDMKNALLLTYLIVKDLMICN